MFILDESNSAKTFFLFCPPFSLGIDVEDMSLAGKYRLFTHSIRLDCHLGSPFAVANNSFKYSTSAELAKKFF
jgi:hypothetical protein